MQLGQLRDRYQEILAAGAKVVAISTEPLIESIVSAMDAQLPYPVLCDPERDVIGEWGLAHDDPGADHPVSRPAAFILDSEGVVRFAYVGEHSRDRPAIGGLLLALSTFSRQSS